MVSQQYSKGDVFTQISDVTKPLSHSSHCPGEDSPADRQQTLLTPLTGPSCRSRPKLYTEISLRVNQVLQSQQRNIQLQRLHESLLP